MRRIRSIKKTTGMLCAGILVLSIAGCQSVSAQETKAPQVTAQADDPESDSGFVDLAKEALKNYFDIYIGEAAGYEVSVQHMKAIPEYGVESQVAVTFLPEELNLGEISADTVIDMENIDTKPMYDVQFTEEGLIKGIHLSYMDWDKSPVPVTVETAKETASGFLTSHQLADKGNMDFLGSMAASSDTIAVVFRHKEGRALLVGVDTLSGNVRFFEDMTESGAVKSITPFEEGKGLG